MEQIKTPRGFKRKTIEQTIHKKLIRWVNTIEDESLRIEALNNSIVTGGAITSMLLGELPNDYDVYFKNAEIAEKIANYYLKKLPEIHNDRVSNCEVRRDSNRVSIFIRSAGIAGENVDQEQYEYFEMTDGMGVSKYLDGISSSLENKEKYTVVYMTTNAITLSDGIQLIIRFIGEPEKIHKNYDFVHTTNWYTNGQLYLNPAAMESTLSKELKYIGSLYPICSMFRLKKFIKRGWTITAGEMLKIAWDINKLDLSKIDILQDQLVGVDAAYFNQIINILKSESNQSIDRTYIFELVNRVFDEYDADEVQELMLKKKENEKE